MPGHIFLSYSRKDSDIMRRVCDDLRAAGLKVWTDESLQPGTPSWQAAIESALGNASVMVVILSPDAKWSEWVGREIQYADAQGIRIFPVLARGDERESVPIALIGTQRVDISHDHEGGLRELVAALNSYLSENAASISAAPRATPPAASRPEQLSPLDFFDDLRLFWWMFFDPPSLITNGIHPSDRVVRQMAAWIVSSMSWIPFLAPAVGLIMGTVQLPDVSSSSNVGLLLSGLLGLGMWLIVARIGWHATQTAGLVLIAAVTTGTLLLFILGAGMDNIRFTAAGGATVAAFLLTTAVSIGTAAGIAFRLAKAATGGLAGIVTASVAYLALSKTQIGSAGGVAGLVMVMTAFLVSSTLEEHLRTGRRTRLSWLVAAVLAGSYAAMIWMYFLGGWQVLKR